MGEIMKRKYILECVEDEDDGIVLGYIVLDLKKSKFDRVSSFKEEATVFDFNEAHRCKKELYKYGFRYRLLIEEIGKENENENENEYPEIPGYTLHGDYYLSDKVIPYKNWKEACDLRGLVILPNGKKVIAHTLSKEELETIPRKERAMGKYWYWTNTFIDDDVAWIVYDDGDFDISHDVNLSSAYGGARLGFKNPFLKEKTSEDEISSAVNEVMDLFDYERVHKAMEFLDWKWVGKGVPEIYDLRVESRRLLEKVANKVIEGEEYYFAATGGFKAEAWKNDEGKLGLRLNFILEDSEN